MTAATPIFDAYVMVDWSAEARPKTGADSVWWTCLERVDGHLVERATANPPTRARAEAELADLLSDLAARGLHVLVGFDFAFGFPAGFAACVEARDWKGVWRRLAAEVKDGADNANNRFEVAARLNQVASGGAAPFWGCPETRQSAFLTMTRPDASALAPLRATERRMAGTKSVWQLFYNGSVGSQTLLGIASLHRLRFHPWLADQSRVWPFETGLAPLARPPEWRVLFAEIYPSMVPVAVPEGGIKDREQVRALARHFAERDRAGALAADFAGPADLGEAERHAAEREEGWILGAGAQPAPAAKVDIHDWIKDPAAIYAESFATIRREIDVAALPPDLADVVVRVVHACGMTDIAADMAWSEGAGEAGRRALAQGAPILVDAEMVAHGIIKRRLPKANPVVCTLNDEGVAPAAKEAGTTRSAMAVDQWLPMLGGAVVAIGNAPTALFRLLELIEAGAPRPALILGFPVGFVGAVESKEALLQSGLPFLTLRGRRGGSAMAAAAVNALAGGLE